MDFDLHICAEDTALGFEALCGEDCEEVLVEGFGFFGRGGSSEAGAAALAAIAVEGELRDAEHAAADVEERAVHLALVVGKDAQVGALFGAEAQGLFVVARAEADEQEQTLVDLADGFSVDGDAGLADALD